MGKRDGSIVFVVGSKKELRGLSQIVKGIVGVTRMRDGHMMRVRDCAQFNNERNY